MLGMTRESFMVMLAVGVSLCGSLPFHLVGSFNSYMNLKTTNTSCTSLINIKEETACTFSLKDLVSLSKLLERLVSQEMPECDLLVAYDSIFNLPEVLQDVLRLPNSRKVRSVISPDYSVGALQEWTKCVGHLLLLGLPDTRIAITSSNTQAWNYQGRNILVGLSMQEFKTLVYSAKGRKMEHLVGVMKGSYEGEWQVYLNSLYWGTGLMKVTTWRDHTFTVQTTVFPDKTSNLLGATLKVVTFPWEPSVFYKIADNGTVILRYGVDVEVARLLARVLNFTADFVEPPTGELWGDQQANGSWSGMMGMLDRGEAEMGAANLYVSISRIKALDYSAPYNLMETCLLARKEPPLPRWQAFAFPFKWDTWLFIMVGLLFSGPILFLLSRETNKTNGSDMIFSMSSSWFYSFGIHVREPLPQLPRQTSTQVFIIFLWLYAIILTVAYCTNLTAYLLVNRPPAAIETIRELYHSGLQVVGLGEFYKRALAAATDQYVNGLSNKYESETTPSAAYGRVLRGTAVFIQNRAFVEFIVKTRFISAGAPTMRIMKECFAPYNIALGLRRNSPLKRRVNEVIGRINQAGLVRHYFLQSLRMAITSKEYGSEDKLTNEEDDGITPLNLDHLQGAFIICSLGLLFAAVTYLFELTICGCECSVTLAQPFVTCQSECVNMQAGAVVLVLVTWLVYLCLFLRRVTSGTTLV